VLGGLAIGAPTQLVADDPSLPAGVAQRFTWRYEIAISDDSDFTAALVNVGLTASIGGATANAILELRQEPNPYEIDGDTFWLSTDLRVFEVKDGGSKFNASLSGTSLGAASTFITQVISNLNDGTAGEDFDNLPTSTSTDVALYQTDSGGTAVFNFALARVRYRALVDDAHSVRVFFRLFPALTVSLAYDQGTTYRQFSDGVLYRADLPFGQALATRDGMLMKAYDPAAITVQDGEFAVGLFVGSGPATVVNPTTIQVFLEQIGSPTVPDVELSATAGTGIVAADDGGTWAGVTALVLPFP